MPFSTKQIDFLRSATHRWNIKTGATRSGKTYMDYFIIPKRILSCPEGGLVVLLGNTRGTLERNILVPMRGLWGGLIGHISSDNTVKIFGRTCYALGADKASSVSRIQGASVAYCYGDEITTWAEPVFSMLKSRLDKPYSKFDGTCNPAGPEHWFKKFLDSDADIYQQAYTIDDNPFLDPTFVTNLKREYAGTVYYDRYILGLWQAADGLVYPMFDPQKHIRPAPETERGEYYISVDYGTLNPFSAGLWLVLDGKAYRIREYYHDGRNARDLKTDEEYYIELEKLAGKTFVDAVIVDPSAASFIELVRRKGRFSIRKADNDVLNGIRTTARFLNEGRLLFAPSCTDCIREFREYVWDEKAQEDKPKKEHDHAMDDMRYFCQTILRRKFREEQNE